MPTYGSTANISSIIDRPIGTHACNRAWTNVNFTKFYCVWNASNSQLWHLEMVVMHVPALLAMPSRHAVWPLIMTHWSEVVRALLLDPLHALNNNTVTYLHSRNLGLRNWRPWVRLRIIWMRVAHTRDLMMCSFWNTCNSTIIMSMHYATVYVNWQFSGESNK